MTMAGSIADESSATDLRAAELRSPSAWAALMDETVAEVFATMLGCVCLPVEEASAAPGEISARVGFFGALKGECVLACSSDAAAELAEAFLGEAADEAMIADSFGELCNMLAGGWKRRLPPPESGAALSVPAVGREKPEERWPHVRRAYGFEGGRMLVALSAEKAARGESS